MWPPAQQVAHQRCLVHEYLAREPVVQGDIHGCDISAVGDGCGRKTADLLRVFSSFVWRGNSIEGDRILVRTDGIKQRSRSSCPKGYPSMNAHFEHQSKHQRWCVIVSLQKTKQTTYT